ncbi:MAG: hypothetical protein Tsb009_07010 [Planctomycetaceae bacterium]
MTTDFPEAYLEGIRLFNEEEFFECHDVLEELWSEVVGEERKFLQGLIQAAVALFHFGNENLGGARKMYFAACEKLTLFGQSYMGIDLDKFLTDLRFCFSELLEAKSTYPDDVHLRDERIPKIDLQS